MQYFLLVGLYQNRQIEYKKARWKIVDRRMSQHNSSILSSGQNPELKYQKALREISKLISTNKMLKNESEEREEMLGSQLRELSAKYEDASAKSRELEEEKRQMEEFIEGLQDTNGDLRKEYQAMERENSYLNDVLKEQNAELQKMSAFKDEKGVSDLLRSYERREAAFKLDVERLESHIARLKDTVDALEADVAEEREVRQRYEDQYNIVGLEIKKYMQLNNYLMEQNEEILSGAGEAESTHSRQKELESFVLEFKRQLESLRNVKFESEEVSEKQYAKNYEALAEEKNSIAISLAKTKDRLEVASRQIEELYEWEERCRAAESKADVLSEENNMLKNRVTVLEAKEIAESGELNEGDSDIKEFEEKVNLMIAKSDPLASIRNGEDNSHFLAMRHYLSEMKSKLERAVLERQGLQRKYAQLKQKFSKRAEECLALQDSNKLLKGKLEGFERIAEKLHFELERSMHAHEDEVVKMVAIANNLVSKKVEESKTASAFLKGQFDLELERAEKAEKTLSQELEALRIEASVQKVRIQDYDEKLRQSREMMQIYQQKHDEIAARYGSLEEENSRLNEGIAKFEQLYREEKIHHETILIQKQNLGAKVGLLSQELNEKLHSYEQQIRDSAEKSAGELRRLTAQNKHLVAEVDSLKSENSSVLKELRQRRESDSQGLSHVKTENEYYIELQNNYNDQKQQISQLMRDLEMFRHKIGEFQAISEKLEKTEAEYMKSQDELNDLKRANIGLTREIGTLQENCSELEHQKTQLTRDFSALKQKFVATSQQQMSGSHSSENLTLRKSVQSLNEQIAILESTVREEKRKNQALSLELQSFKEGVSAKFEEKAQLRSKEQTLTNSLSQSLEEKEQLREELESVKSRLVHCQSTLRAVSDNLNEANQTIEALKEEVQSAKLRLSKRDAKYNSLTSELNLTKHHLEEVEKMVHRLSRLETLEWDQKRERDSLAALVSELKRIYALASSSDVGTAVSGDSSNNEYSFVPASSFGNLEPSLQSNGGLGHLEVFNSYAASKSASSNNTFSFGKQGASGDAAHRQISTNNTFAMQGAGSASIGSASDSMQGLRVVGSTEYLGSNQGGTDSRVRGNNAGSYNV